MVVVGSGGEWSFYEISWTQRFGRGGGTFPLFRGGQRALAELYLQNSPEGSKLRILRGRK